MDGATARAERAVDDADLPDGLSRREYDILSFERQWWKYAGAKEEAIKELFSMSATRYYQVLNALVDRPEALAADPVLGSDGAAVRPNTRAGCEFGPFVCGLAHQGRVEVAVEQVAPDRGVGRRVAAIVGER